MYILTAINAWEENKAPEENRKFQVYRELRWVALLRTGESKTKPCSWLRETDRPKIS